MTGKVLLPLLLASAAQAEGAWVVEPDQALVSVEAGPAKARILATSRGVSGRIHAFDDGTIQAEVRLSAASFTTGNAERDQKLDRDGEIVFEGRATAPGKDGKLHLKGTLTVHGVSRLLEVPVSVVRAGTFAFVHATFMLPLAEFGLPAGEARVDVDAGLRPENTVATRG
jgi:polyisoprenoid-binding protein YceI